jgi:U3 small nucleolar RNA-associated protein 12
LTPQLDCATGEVVESSKGHGGAIWSIAQSPFSNSFVSGGADKEVKFWQFVSVSDGGEQRVGFTQTKAMTMTDEVMCVRMTKSNKFVRIWCVWRSWRQLCVSLMDGTTRVFYADSLTFFLSLYGHRLPVLCADASDDDALLVTGSADKNVRIWGLDFGDCHKSVFYRGFSC